jgi:hypothetical protein
MEERSGRGVIRLATGRKAGLPWGSTVRAYRALDNKSRMPVAEYPKKHARKRPRAMGNPTKRLYQDEDREPVGDHIVSPEVRIALTQLMKKIGIL